MQDLIEILIVDDNALDKSIIEDYLNLSKIFRFKLDHVFRLSQAKIKLDLNFYDVVILDLGLPDSHGLETFTKLHSAFPKIPILIISGYESAKIAEQAISHGAIDFIVKGKFNTEILEKAIKFVINSQRTRNSITEHQKNLSSRPSSLKSQEILDEFCEEYQKLIPLSSDINPSLLSKNIEVFFDTHLDAFKMLGLSLNDLDTIHYKTFSRINLLDKNSESFKKTEALLLKTVKQIYSKILEQ